MPPSPDAATPPSPARLFVVDVQTEVLVWAESHAEAEALARQHHDRHDSYADPCNAWSYYARYSRSPYGTYCTADWPPNLPILSNLPHAPKFLSQAIDLDRNAA